MASVALAPKPAAAQAGPSTPAELVATYNSLADGILALKRTEEDLCRSILAAAYAHGRRSSWAARRRRSRPATRRPRRPRSRPSRPSVGQLATEGDNAVAAVRKKLLDGGHHHNAAGEAQGIFDEGFVIVTKAAKAQAARVVARDRPDGERPEGRRPRRRVEEGRGGRSPSCSKPAK